MRTDSIDFDTVLDLCSQPHRRIALAVLVDDGRAVTRDELTEKIAVHNHHVAIDDLEEVEITRIDRLLHHVHLPKLEVAGVIVYDVDRALAVPTDRLADIRPSLLGIIDADPAIEIRP